MYFSNECIDVQHDIYKFFYVLKVTDKWDEMW